MQELRTEIHISASAEDVWSILMDFESYPEWNPFVTSISGDKQVDGQLEATLNIGRAMGIKPKVQEIEPNRKFSWLGRTFLPRIFDGKHIFEIEENGTGVKFIQREEFKGILVWPIMKMIGEKTREGFEAMNDALKKRIEQAN